MGQRKECCPSCGQPMSPMAAYRRELNAGDPVAVMVDQACDAAGATVLMYSISTTTDRLPPGCTIAVGNMKLIAQRHGIEALTRVLKVLVAAKRGPIKAGEIAAAAQVLLASGARDQDLTRVISTRNAAEWSTLAALTAREQGTKVPDEIAKMWARELGVEMRKLPRRRPEATAQAPRALRTIAPVEPMTSEQSPGDLPGASTRDDQVGAETSRGWHFEHPAENGRPRAKDPVPKPEPERPRFDHRQRLREAADTMVRLKPKAQPAPRALPMLPQTSGPWVTHEDLSLDIGNGVLSFRNASIAIKSQEAIDILGRVMKVAPSLIDQGYLAKKVLGDARTLTLLRHIIESQANPVLEQFGYTIKWVSSIGCTLQPVG